MRFSSRRADPPSPETCPCAVERQEPHCGAGQVFVYVLAAGMVSGKSSIAWGKGMAKAKAVTIYGIKNCDTMKKARAWLDQHGVGYAFHDYKAEGVERDVLQGWARAVGWETLLN